MSDELKPIVLTFGYGINRRSRPQDIDEQECYDGENFDLSHQFFALHRRDAFTLVETAPNRQEIRGYAQLVNRDGSVSTLIQAGGTVYHLTFDDGWTWTSVGTVLPTARLRGPRSHNWLLDQYVIITDLEKVETVKKWDGTTFGEFAHNLTGDFKAKFCRVHGERAYFGNVETTTDTPHVILASELGDAEVLTVADRPASTLSDEDPFFLPTPDLRPINGVEKGFGQLFFSTQDGQLHRLSGTSAKDFELISFYEGSAVSGDEALLNIGNDILMGLEGRIETLSGTLNFGDVETDDASQWIRPLVEDVRQWKFAYNRRLQRVYCIPDGGGLVWVLNKALLNAAQLQDIRSPWSKWTTQHDIAFNPSTMWSMVDPSSNLEQVFFGDRSGRLYAMEGSTGEDASRPVKAVSFATATAVSLQTATDQDSRYYLSGRNGVSATATSLLRHILLNAWVQTTPPGTEDQWIWNHASATGGGSQGLVQLRFLSGNNVTWNVGVATNFFTFSHFGALATGQWHHLITTVDIPNRAVDMWIDGVSSTATVNVFNSPPADVIVNTQSWYIGGLSGEFKLSEFLVHHSGATHTLEDISDAAVRSKFVDDLGRPRDQGADGDKELGYRPLIYLAGGATDIQNNAGRLPNMTVVGGGFDDTTPPVGLIGSPITLSRRSKIIQIPGLDMFDIKGWITYLRAFAATVTITFEYGGTNVFDQSITIQLPANPDLGVYNGDSYYNGDAYYNAGFEGRLSRQKFSAAGRASFVQVKIEVEGAEDVEISEIGMWFSVAKDN